MKPQVLASFVLATTLAACGGGGGRGSSNPPPPPPPPPVTIAPATATVDVGATQTFTAGGGTPPYTFSVTAGGGTIDAAGVYTPPASAGTATVRVADSGVRSANATITLPGPLTLAPLSATVGAGTTATFTAAGGRPPYTYAVVAGGGAVSNAGVYTAPATPGNATRATDGRGVTLDAAITINPALSLSSDSITITAGSNQTWTFAASGGVPPYTYTATGPGSVDNAGVYHAGVTTGRARVTARDAQGTEVLANVLSIWVRANSRVRAIASDASHVYIGGDFNAVNAHSSRRMIMLDAANGDADLDCNVDVGFDGPVYAIARAGNSYYVGGEFTNYAGNAARRLVKIDATTCAMDPLFTLAFGPGGGAVHAIAVVGSSVYIGGDFGLYRDVPAERLAKLDATTGNLDTTFTQPTGVDGVVKTIVPGPGNTLFVGGDFSSYRGTPVRSLLKINAVTGVADAAFLGQSMDGYVNVLAFDGTALFAGGYFNDYRGINARGPLKLDPTTGALDTTFTQPEGADGSVHALVITAGWVYAGGAFTQYRGANVSNLVRIAKTTGNLDTSFAAALDGDVYALALSPADNTLYAGGNFETWGAAEAHQLARVNATTGAVDTTFTRTTGFNPAADFGAPHAVRTLHLSANALMAGGDFTTYRGTFARRIARLELATGAADAAFSSTLVPNRFAISNFNSNVSALQIIGNSLFVAGPFATSGTNYQYLVKVDKATGAVDTTFNQAMGFDGNPVFSLAQHNGALYVGGAYTQYRGQNVASVAKLDPVSGNADPAFHVTLSLGDPVYAIAPMNSSLYLGGWFFPSLAKVDAGTGAHVPAWSGVQTSDFVYSSLATAGGVYFGGNFSSASGVASQSIAKLDPTTGTADPGFLNSAGFGAGANVYQLVLHDGALFAGGFFSVSHFSAAQNVVKLDPMTGAMIPAFSSGGGPDGSVRGLHATAAGLWIGGDFDLYRAFPGHNLVLVDPTNGDPRDR
jgi:hypothetical protein